MSREAAAAAGGAKAGGKGRKRTRRGCVSAPRAPSLVQ